MKRMTFCLMLLILSGGILAGDHVSLAGKVLGESSEPIPYASIFFMHHPQTGTVSDDRGKFRIDFDTDTTSTGMSADTIMKDTLIISMLGYETTYVPASRFKGSRPLTLRMKEYRYTLDEALVKASRNDRKHRMEEMKSLLGRIYQRLTTVDAPRSEDVYRIASDIVILRDSTPITINHLTGSLTEIPGGRHDGRDSIIIRTATFSNYMDSSVRESIQNLDISKLSKKEKKAVKKAEQKSEDKTILHRAVWSVTDVEKVLKGTADEIKYWKYREKDDSTLTVFYSRKSGFLGIISATRNIFLTVDRNTAAIRSASCDITADIKLPFGYKLNPGELEILNMVNLNEDDLDKYKIKTAVIEVRGVEINRASGGRMVPSEKSMKNTVSICDRKDRRLDFTNTCMLKVLEFK